MRSWCFDSVATEVDGVTTYDREYGSAEFREVISKLVGNGVYANPASNMQVVVTGGLNVAVQPGCCWIQGAFGVVDETETLTIEPSTNGRYDAIVARFDLSLASRDIHLAVVKGTEGSLMRPTLTRNASIYELQLASIRVNTNATAISTTDITDTRYSSSYCGIVTGVIDQINTTGLFIQYEAQFYKFLDEIKNSLTGDVAGNLLSLIDNHKADKNNPHNVTASQVGLGNVLNEKQYCESNPPPNLTPHIENTNNPHNVTKEQVGLGNVLNEKQYCESNPPIKILWFNSVNANGTASIPIDPDYDIIMAAFMDSDMNISSLGGRQYATLVCCWGDKVWEEYVDSSNGGGMGTIVEYKNMYDSTRRKLYITNNESSARLVRIIGIKS